MEQKRLDLYYMDMKYVRDLHNIDDNVQSVSPQIHKNNRPFIGIVVICENHQYCVPIDSPKKKHHTMKNAVDITKIYHNNKLIGVLNFNNMIPVDERFIKKIDLKIKPYDTPAERHYKGLCTDEITWCRNNQDAIIRKANKLYKLLQQPNVNRQLKKRCNDFKRLEEVLARK